MSKSKLQIFKTGSKTYFYSSIFFPPKVRDDVFTLYAFVRVADDYVDAIPQDIEGFTAFEASYRKGLEGEASGNHVIDDFVALMQKKSFDPAWVDAFLDSMRMDTEKDRYNTIDETLAYIYGSAEVIGLMMSAIMNLPPEAYPAAKALGRSMQYINFIRDIAEDLDLNRIYFPQDDMNQFGLASLKEEDTKGNPNFVEFYLKQVDLYKSWQKEAEQGFHYIPKRYRIPIKTASDLYLWTASVIEKDPSIVYTRKVKPTIPRILMTLLKNVIVA